VCVCGRQSSELLQIKSRVDINQWNYGRDELGVKHNLITRSEINAPHKAREARNNSTGAVRPGLEDVEAAGEYGARPLEVRECTHL
jgi:hypothetical protein